MVLDPTLNGENSYFAHFLSIWYEEHIIQAFNS